MQYTLYIPYLHTLLYDTVQHIYTHTLIYSDTPSHDLLLLHKDIHIIPVYASPSAMPYIISIIQTIGFRNRIDSRQSYNRKT